MARKEIVAVSYIRRGEDLVRFDSLPEQEKERVRGHCADVFSEVIGEYMRTHPEEKAQYIKNNPRCVID